MHVAELWRFPVKSLGGEPVERCRVTGLGVDGDRRWAVRDRETGRVLTARREGRLLQASARCGPGGTVVLTLPDGTETDDGRDLAAWLDRDVELVPAGDTGATYESPRDAERETGWYSWQGPPGAFHDSGQVRVSLVSTGTLGSWDRRRFRANVVLDGEGEDELVGRSIVLGSTELRVQKRLGRCVMVTRAQPGIDRDLGVLRTINAERDGCLAIGALVRRDGTIAVGDAVV